MIQLAQTVNPSLGVCWNRWEMPVFTMVELGTGCEKVEYVGFSTLDRIWRYYSWFFVQSLVAQNLSQILSKLEGFLLPFPNPIILNQLINYFPTVSTNCQRWFKKSVLFGKHIKYLAACIHDYLHNKWVIVSTFSGFRKQSREINFVKRDIRNHQRNRNQTNKKISEFTAASWWNSPW